ncbi:hypothetical protein AA0121_g12034 [Alternaria tenuissima]|nr:hypothetical protein AA0121_g12034 [Alternaria tenuissima]RYO53503.1 hypothetical protein AA0116_g10187 [Alternaria tenuissima]
MLSGLGALMPMVDTEVSGDSINMSPHMRTTTVIPHIAVPIYR